MDRTLTSGVARAFIDQTLAAVRETDGADASVVGSVEGLHQETARTMSSLRTSNSKDGPQRAAWQTLLDDFVSGVEAAAADGQVWAHLRHRLLGDAGGVPAPVPRGNAQFGEAPAEVTGQLSGGEQEGRLARWLLQRSLPQAGTEQASARVVLRQWLDRGGVVLWPGWQERPLVGVFRSVLVLGVLRWPDPGRQDSPELVGLRDRLGRRVVGALWRSVEADTADADVAGVAGLVAVAVTRQAPGVPGDLELYSGADRMLTAGVARAFIDQTLAAVRETAWADASVMGSVEDLHQETARTMTRLHSGNSKNGPQRGSWQRLLTDFVSGIDATDRQVWAHLRDRLLAVDSRAPVPALSGAGEPSDELSGLADPGLLPGDLDDWAGLADFHDLADLLELDNWPELADPLVGPPTEPPAGSPGGPGPNRVGEPGLDQGGPDPSWLRRLMPDHPPSSAPAPAARGESSAGVSVPDASPTLDRTNTGGPPAGRAQRGRRKRKRDEGHQPGPGKRVARQQE